MTCRNPGMRPDRADFMEAARELDVDVESVIAIQQVESSGSGFDKHGRPTILFERHYFYRLTGGSHTLPVSVYSECGHAL